MPVAVERKPREDTVDIFPDLNTYDYVIGSLSGGKDSQGCILWALERGIDPSKLVLVHQCIDGYEDTKEEFFDWPVTEAYCQAFADYLHVPLVYQWRSRGILGEMERFESRTGDVYYKDPGQETVHLPTKQGECRTRMMFPAKMGDLSKRYCSSAAKIDVFRRYLANHPDYQTGTKENPVKILVLTGERREESSNRYRYARSELHPANSQKRIVHWYRPLIDYTEAEVWDLLRRHSIRPHPAYQIGFSRVSCMTCIFLDANLWQMVRAIAPDRFGRVERQEKKMGHTLDNKKSLHLFAEGGTLERMPLYDDRIIERIEKALGTEFSVDDIRMPDWELPAGAFHGSCGGAI